jgi:hypothetical protein
MKRIIIIIFSLPKSDSSVRTLFRIYARERERKKERKKESHGTETERPASSSHSRSLMRISLRAREFLVENFSPRVGKRDSIF